MSIKTVLSKFHDLTTSKCFVLPILYTYVLWSHKNFFGKRGCEVEEFKKPWPVLGSGGACLY